MTGKTLKEQAGFLLIKSTAPEKRELKRKETQLP
jgi:hypothetical protein